METLAALAAVETLAALAAVASVAALEALPALAAVETLAALAALAAVETLATLAAVETLAGLASVETQVLAYCGVRELSFLLWHDNVLLIVASWAGHSNLCRDCTADLSSREFICKLCEY